MVNLILRRFLRQMHLGHTCSRFSFPIVDALPDRASLEDHDYYFFFFQNLSIAELSSKCLEGVTKSETFRCVHEGNEDVVVNDWTS